VSEASRLVDLGTLPKPSLDAARDELEAAQQWLWIVHRAQQVDLRLRKEAEDREAAEEFRVDYIAEVTRIAGRWDSGADQGPNR
jgi:hypothetical protein